MTPVLMATLAFMIYFLGYYFYSKYLAQKLYELDPQQVTPAHTLSDGVDYVPTQAPILFGHHFASITGLAPMLGPAIAVIWGWVPATLWVVFGAIFIGCVHDFSALILSVRHQGQSIGTVAQSVLGARARVMFLCIIFFGVALAMGVFVFVISKLFGLYLTPPTPALDGKPGSLGVPGYPEAAFPSLWLMMIAAVSGWLLERRGAQLTPVISIGFLLSLVGIWGGLYLKEQGIYALWWPSSQQWILALLSYAFLASVLPVWSLLQPRDFLNSLLLYLGVGLAYLGLFVKQPDFVAPAFVPNPVGAPPILPFVFILIACGSASGFHGLVSSGTTAKQLNHEPDARPIAYGGMIGESLLGLLAVLACTAGFRSADIWQEHYASFHAASGLAKKLGGFIEGTTGFLMALGLPQDISSALIAMVVVSFALTTLDSATRLLRFNIEELTAPIAQRWGGPFKSLGNRYVSSFLACATIGMFAFYEVNGKPAALALWALFGTTNQLLAGLTLTVATLYLRSQGKSTIYTGVPALFMLLSTFTSMGVNLFEFAQQEQPDLLLLSVGGALFMLGVWMVLEASLSLMRSDDVT